MKVIWTAFAGEQLDDIYRFIKSDSEIAAINRYNDILDAGERLCDFPKMAPLEPLLLEFPEMYRSLVVCHHYKIIYYIKSETIYIVAVFDCRQNPKKLKDSVRKQ